LPAGKSNTFIAKLKKQANQKKPTGTANNNMGRPLDAAPSAEDIQNGKKKMRKYLDKASS
jgi:hypothetical protein